MCQRNLDCDKYERSCRCPSRWRGWNTTRVCGLTYRAAVIYSDILNTYARETQKRPRRSRRSVAVEKICFRFDCVDSNPTSASSPIHLKIKLSEIIITPVSCFFSVPLCLRSAGTDSWTQRIWIFFVSWIAAIV